MTNRLVAFLPQLEADLSSFSDDPDLNLRFLAMLAGPFYPILHIVNERLAGNTLDSEAPKNSQPSSALTVSSNFEPRRSRSTSTSSLPTVSSIVFRADTIFMLLRKAYRDSHLGTFCRMASRILLKFIEPLKLQQGSVPSSDETCSPDEASKSDLSNPPPLVDYSNLFGEEFRIPDDYWDTTYLSVLDVAAVEEGIFHVLCACASQPLLCSKLADSMSDFWSALPLVQALLPALRPNLIGSDHVDDSFSQWKQPSVQHALSQIVATSALPVFRPLLHVCAGFLSSVSPSHAKAACVLIDLCSGVLAPWMAQVIAKVDLTLELLEDLLGVIQGAHRSLARAALKYIILALSGHMDDIIAKYKDVKHRILFLLEMLEPFLDPAITPMKSPIAFGNVSPVFQEQQAQTCEIALNVIRTAVRKPAVLPSLESEWRRGSVAPSVLLSILEPHMRLPPEIDHCKYPVAEPRGQETTNVSPLSSVPRIGGASSKFINQDDADGKTDAADTSAKMDTIEDVSLFFAPSELRNMALTSVSGSPDRMILDLRRGTISAEDKHVVERNCNNLVNNGLAFDAGGCAEYFNLHADYMQLINYRDCELRASEFRRLALDLQSQHQITPEGHDAALDALLLAAECYVNPFFLTSFRDAPKVLNRMNISDMKIPEKHEFAVANSVMKKNNNDLETVAFLERRRDKIVLEILLEAAELDKRYQKTASDRELSPIYAEENEEVLSLSQSDILSADAVTLVRQNQEKLCKFLIQRLQKEQQSMHEILMQSLLFLLQSATKLFCSPEDIVDIILGSAEHLTGLLTSIYHHFKEGNLQLDSGKVHEVQRRWMLLQRLVIASSGCDEAPDFTITVNNGFRFANLIPSAAWMQKIRTFSSSTSPLVRFLGWMAVSRNAKQYLKERLFLVSDLSQLMYLLSIFADELSLVDNIAEENDEKKIQRVVQDDRSKKIGFEIPSQQNADQSFQAVYPAISQFFPSMRKQFEAFGEIILESVGLQLRSLSSSVVPDLLCWFSDLCSWPFFQKGKDHFVYQNSSASFKGFVAKNAKAIILYTLEAIVIEHMEAMVPEIPRVVQVLVSLSRTSYCDVSFLDSVLRLLKPIISYSLHKVSNEEELFTEDSCVNFESLCFEELFTNVRESNENEGSNNYSRALTIFILATVFPDLSFHRKREILQCLREWADFTTSGPTTYCHDYLCAFQTLMESCMVLLVETLKVHGAIPLNVPLHSDVNTGVPADNSLESHFVFLDEVCESPRATEMSEKPERHGCDGVMSQQKVCHLAVAEVEDFSKDLEALISKINPTIELCWKIHHQLAKKLTVASAQCYVYSRCISSIAHKVSISAPTEDESILPSKSVDQFTDNWKIALEGLSEMIIVLQETHCWEVASVMFDCLLRVPRCFSLDSVIGTVCNAIKKFSFSGPTIAWRLQTDKWLSLLFARGIESLKDGEIPLVNVLCAMLGHAEPEQRFISLQHLGRLVSQDVYNGKTLLSSVSHDNPLVNLVSEPILKILVSSSWDRVAVVASSDVSLLLRTRAMLLLVDYVPFSERHQLQSVLASADSVLYGLGRFAHATCEGPLVQLSLAILASVCLHSPAEDISLIPQEVWKNIETLGMSSTEGKPGELEKKACQALCRLKYEGDDAKENLKEVLSSSSSKQVSLDFGSTRESILQVLANLTSVQSYFDFFAKKIDQKVTELEEAEMELDLLQKEQVVQESSLDSKEWSQHPFVATCAKDDDRLQKIKDSIRSLEKSKLKEEIIARRQKKLLVRRARQKYLEEAALREAELLQELDSERTTEVEREIERQTLLELERAKTRELRHQLDMEKEKQSQRDLQRELEQVESGLRPTRREFSTSTHSSRPRERYRERENGRSSNEGNLRATSGSLQAETGTSNSSLTTMPSVVLAGSRPFSVQVPTILQSRDRLDDGGSSYEENFDGSKDSGDTGSVGDADLVSALEGQPGGVGSAQRHGSRGSKSSRQMIERRERDGRREGKWERKHY